MKTEVFKIDDCIADSESILKAAKIVQDGGLVVFPTETVYGIACKAETDALEKLSNVKSRQDEKRYSLHIGSKEQLGRYIPSMGLRVRKLIDVFWPGPVTVVFEVSDGDIQKLKKTLPQETIEALYIDGTIGVRCPDNELSQLFLQNIDAAVVASSANISGRQASTTAAQAIHELGGMVDAVLDGDPDYGCKYNQGSTVVKVATGKMEILREGSISKNQIEEKSTVNICFVCTGNTCRSPMAEYFCKKYISEKLNCDVDELTLLGYNVMSAGTMAAEGCVASPEVVSICGEKGADASAHRSRLICEYDVRSSDFIFVMTGGHYQQVLQMWPWAANKCFLLGGDEDVADPIGAGMGVYRTCAEQIESYIIKRLSESIL